MVDRPLAYFPLDFRDFDLETVVHLSSFALIYKCVCIFNNYIALNTARRTNKMLIFRALYAIIIV